MQGSYSLFARRVLILLEMIFAARTNLLTLYPEKLSKEVAYLPEKACYTALMTLAGAVFDSIVGFLRIRRCSGLQVSVTKVADIVPVAVCVGTVIAIHNLRLTADLTAVLAGALAYAVARKDKCPIIIIAVTLCRPDIRQHFRHTASFTGTDFSSVFSAGCVVIINEAVIVRAVSGDNFFLKFKAFSTVI
jgi:hypothetical protein